ncbi:hypothetical protein [Flaviaesturariibacter amylovorans]|uniref:Uncharacterized protein n=1 Tax=Flaviaesturariibacter amylovorans TaxID=1084520 RepID=A0ABP8H7P6_9BACT
MRLSDFVLLCPGEKKFTVLHRGVLVAKRAIPGHLVLLFQMKGYYVEAFCHVESKAIARYSAFVDPRHLDVYLDAIRLDELLH